MMGYRDKYDDQTLEILKSIHKKLDADYFEEDFTRRRDICEVEGQIDYWYSDNSLRGILSEQHELLISEKQGHEKLMDSLSGEIKQLRKKIEEKEGENDNGKNC